MSVFKKKSARTNKPAPDVAESWPSDHFDCPCGPARNLSMEMGVYKCHGCGKKESAQTLECRKAAAGKP